MILEIFNMLFERIFNHDLTNFNGHDFTDELEDQLIYMDSEDSGRESFFVSTTSSGVEAGFVTMDNGDRVDMSTGEVIETKKSKSKKPTISEDLIEWKALTPLNVANDKFIVRVDRIGSSSIPDNKRVIYIPFNWIASIEDVSSKPSEPSFNVKLKSFVSEDKYFKAIVGLSPIAKFL
jgi:hypothetical protein